MTSLSSLVLHYYFHDEQREEGEERRRWWILSPLRIDSSLSPLFPVALTLLYSSTPLAPPTPKERMERRPGKKIHQRNAKYASWNQVIVVIISCSSLSIAAKGQMKTGQSLPSSQARTRRWGKGGRKELLRWTFSLSLFHRRG